MATFMTQEIKIHFSQNLGPVDLGYLYAGFQYLKSNFGFFIKRDTELYILCHLGMDSLLVFLDPFLHVSIYMLFKYKQLWRQFSPNEFKEKSIESRFKVIPGSLLFRGTDLCLIKRNHSSCLSHPT